MKRHHRACLLLTLILGPCVLGAAQTRDPLPRIAVRTGDPAEFYNTESGCRFLPEGNNYIKLIELAGTLYHTTFNEGLYDAGAAETALTQMAHDGYNTVRVFLNNGTPATGDQGWHGISGPPERNVPELYPPYVANLFDFIERAHAHRIYVIPTLDWIPNNAHYNGIAFESTTPNVGGTNQLQLNAGHIQAKAAYMAQLVSELQAHDPALLSTVLAWEIQNELSSNVDEPPYSLLSGTVSPADGQSYDMADLDDRQACHENGWVHYFDVLVAAVRAVDPDALVGTSCFTYAAVHKDVGAANYGVVPRDAPDPRFPVLPRNMLAASLDYIDIHLYNGDSATWDIAADLESSAFAALERTVKPIIMGEFGAFTFAWPDLTSAAFGMREQRAAAYGLGFRGALFWTWDSYIQTTLWHALDSNGAINGVLYPHAREHEWGFDTDGDLEGWTPINHMAGVSVEAGLLNATITGIDPYMQRTGLAVDALYATRVTVRMRSRVTGGQAIRLFWTRADDPTWDEAKSRSLPIDGGAAPDTFVFYTFALCAAAEWTGTVTGLRVDPVEGPAPLTGDVAIDFIAAGDEVILPVRAGAPGNRVERWEVFR